MGRLVKPTGKGAAAALAAAALLACASSPTSAQQVVIPPPQEAAKVEVPGAAQSDRTPEKIRQQEAQRAAPNAQVVAAMRQAALAQGPAAIEQGLQQLRPVFRRELRLLTSAAEPSPSQRREIAIEAGRTLRENVGQLARNQFNQPGRMGAALNQPREVVRKHLELAAWSKLSNVQSARYRAELDRKDEARKEVVVLNVVANLDGHLRLDAAQREKLREAIRSTWDDRDFPMFETMIPYDQYVPTIPNQAILFILTEEQRKIWRSLRKVHLSAIPGILPLDDALTIDLPDDEPDEDVKAALGEEVKR